MNLLNDIDNRLTRFSKYLPPPPVKGAKGTHVRKVFRPQPGPQTQFFTTEADIIIYGGAAGAGKTWSLLVEALRHVNNGGFGAVIFRRTYPQITNQGGMWDESNLIYPFTGGHPRIGDLDWTWDSGARVSFRHLMYEKELQDWQGAQIPYIGWDQLEHFSEKQFWYMLSRSRSMCGVKPFVRGTVNPDADSWVADLIEWWIDEDTGFPIAERGGKIRWFIRKNDETYWANSAEELYKKHGNPAFPVGHPEQIEPKSFTFIPAKITDNQALLKKDPGYLANLKALGEVERQRLLEGNWKVKYEAGKIFNRNWFKLVYEAPMDGRFVRGWDFAATEKKIKGPDPDFTASCLIQACIGDWTGRFIIHDATAEQLAPTDADRLVRRTAQSDSNKFGVVGIRWEEEPGAAGKRDSAHLTQMLSQYDCMGIRPRGDKYQRSKPAARQAEAGNFYIMHGAWNRRWLGHMHGQPDLPHDDEHDAYSVAYRGLTVSSYTIPGSWSKSKFGKRGKGKLRRKQSRQHL